MIDVSQPWVAVLCGFLVAAISAFIAWLGLRWTASRPGLMIAAVLGGTMVRLVLVGAGSIALLLSTSVNPTIYMISLAICYLVFLGGEIYLVVRRASGAGPVEEPTMSVEEPTDTTSQV